MENQASIDLVTGTEPGSSYLSRRLLLMWHSRLGWHRVLACDRLLLGLHILLIGNLLLLFGCHVVWWEVRISDRWSRYLWMIVDIFRRVNGSLAIHPVLVASCRFRRVEASLERRGISQGSPEHVTGK